MTQVTRVPGPREPTPMCSRGLSNTRLVRACVLQSCITHCPLVTAEYLQRAVLAQNQDASEQCTFPWVLFHEPTCSPAVRRDAVRGGQICGRAQSRERSSWGSKENSAAKEQGRERRVMIQGTRQRVGMGMGRQQVRGDNGKVRESRRCFLGEGGGRRAVPGRGSRAVGHCVHSLLQPDL